MSTQMTLYVGQHCSQGLQGCSQHSEGLAVHNTKKAWLFTTLRWPRQRTDITEVIVITLAAVTLGVLIVCKFFWQPEPTCTAPLKACRLQLFSIANGVIRGEFFSD
jgi:hypothetical protein